MNSNMFAILNSEETVETTVEKTVEEPLKIVLGPSSYIKACKEREFNRRNDSYNSLIAKHTADIATLRNKDEMRFRLIKSKFCNSLSTGEPCTRGEKCAFAHSMEELNIVECLFGSCCNKIGLSNAGKLYNKNQDNKCSFLHPGETKQQCLRRVGIKTETVN